MSAAAYDANDVEALRTDLDSVMDRRLSNSYKQADDDYEVKHSTLARVVRAIKGKDAWRHSPYHALHEVVRDAIAKLPDVFGGERASYRNSPERYIAEILFGFRNDEIPPRFIDGAQAELSYSKDYLPYAVTVSGVALPPGTRGNMTKRVRDDIARILLDMEKDAEAQIARTASQPATAAAIRALSNSQAVPTRNTSGYVPRLLLESQLDEALSLGTNGVVLTGAAGFGKTTLARHFIDKLPPDVTRLWLDASSDEALSEGIMDALEATQYASDIIMRKRLLRLHLQSDQAPMYVVFDGGEQARIESIIKHPLKPTVIITNHDTFNLASTKFATVLVDGMAIDECRNLVASLGPYGVEFKNDAELFHSLKRNPRLIARNCAYQKMGSKDDRYWKRHGPIVSDPFTLLSDAIKYPGTSLDEVYLHAIDDISEDAAAMSLLRLLSLRPDLHTQRGRDAILFLIGYITGNVDKPEEYWKELMQRAIRTLARRHLIVKENSKLRSSAPHILLKRMPPDETIAFAQQVADACVAYAVRCIELYGISPVIRELYYWRTGTRGAWREGEVPWSVMYGIFGLMMDWNYRPLRDPGRPLLSKTGERATPSAVYIRALSDAIHEWIKKRDLSEDEFKTIFTEALHPRDILTGFGADAT